MDDPTFELYMYSLNQEFPVGVGHSTFLIQRQKGQMANGTDVAVTSIETMDGSIASDLASTSVADWSAQWLDNKWIENHTKAIGLGRRPEYDPFVTAILREEDFGSVLFEPRTDRVFKMNDAGTLLFSAIRRARGPGDERIDFEAIEKEGFDSEVVAGFLSRMRDSGFWVDE